MSPPVLGDDGVSRLGAAIEPDHSRIRVPGDDRIHGQTLAFIAEIGADNDDRVARFHGVTCSQVCYETAKKWGADRVRSDEAGSLAGPAAVDRQAADRTPDDEAGRAGPGLRDGVTIVAGHHLGG